MTNEEKIKEIVKEWLKKEHSPQSYVYDNEDLSSVGLDGYFNVEELANMVRQQTLEEAIACLPKKKDDEPYQPITDGLIGRDYVYGWKDHQVETLSNLNKLIRINNYENRFK